MDSMANWPRLQNTKRFQHSTSQPTTYTQYMCISISSDSSGSIWTPVLPLLSLGTTTLLALTLNHVFSHSTWRPITSTISGRWLGTTTGRLWQIITTKWVFLTLPIQLALRQWYQCYHCPTGHPALNALTDLSKYWVETSGGHIQHFNVDKPDKDGMGIYSTFYYPNASITIS